MIECLVALVVSLLFFMFTLYKIKIGIVFGCNYNKNLQLKFSSCSSLEEAKKYKVEPYVIAADIYGGNLAGRGGWTWYTGSSSWMYEAGIKYILGLKIEKNIGIFGVLIISSVIFWLLGLIPILGTLIIYISAIFGIGTIVANLLPKKEKKDAVEVEKVDDKKEEK